jgi:hypothetical protein
VSANIALIQLVYSPPLTRHDDLSFKTIFKSGNDPCQNLGKSANSSDVSRFGLHFATTKALLVTNIQTTGAV